MRFSKKAQIAGQIFIYILAAFLFALILMYGYKSIAGLMQKSEQVALVDLKTDLTAAVKSVRSTADVKKRTMVLPSKYTEICFISTGATSVSGLQDAHPMIYDSWYDGLDQNVYLVPQADFEMNIGNIEVDDGWLCIQAINSQIVLRLEGKGDRTKISEWGSS